MEKKKTHLRMKYLLVCLLCLSISSKAQILCDYEFGPSLNEIKDLSFTKYSFSEGWFRSTVNMDHTVTVVNSQTGIRSIVIYLKGKTLPEYVLEELPYSKTSEFISSLYTIGFKRAAADTWIRTNGDVMVLHDNRGKPGEVHYSHEMLAFFSLHNTQNEVLQRLKNQ